MLKKLICLMIAATCNLSACVTYDPSSNTYTVDNLGCIGEPQQENQGYENVL